MIRHRLAGYDPASERLVSSQDIPESLARQLVTFEPDDPKGCYTYRVEWASFLKPRALGQLVQILPLLWILTHLRRGLQLDYFVEPSAASSPSHAWPGRAADSVTRGDARSPIHSRHRR